MSEFKGPEAEAPALTRMQVDMIRANVNAFVVQSGNSTTALMPFMPKRLLSMLDTIDRLYQQLETPPLD